MKIFGHVTSANFMFNSHFIEKEAMFFELVQKINSNNYNFISLKKILGDEVFVAGKGISSNKIS